MGQIFEIINSPNVHRVRRATYEGNKQLREANNTRKAAETALQEFSRTLGNQLALDAAGKEYNAVVGQIAGSLDAMELSKANTAIAAAGVQGALAARAAAAGVGGSSIDLLESTTRLQRDMAIEEQEEGKKKYAINATRASTNVLSNVVNGLDQTQTFAGLDRTIDVAPKPLKNRWGAVIGVAVATYFGGPEAGKAAADTTLGSWNASNGNYQAASQYYSSAVSGGMQGFKNYTEAKSNGYNSWWSQVTAPRQSAAPSNAGNNSTFGSESSSWYKSSDSGSWFG